MVSEEYAEPTGQEPEFLDLDAILAEYRRRQRIEAWVGPVISILFHAVVVVLAFLLMTGETSVDRAAVEVQMEELQIKELEEKLIQELDEVEELVEDVVPTVEKPDLPRQELELATDDINTDMLALTNTAMDFSEVLDIKASDSPLQVSALFGGRTDSGRVAARRRHGGDEQTEDAVLRALRWLKLTQNPDGSWSRTQPEAMAGLCLLAFLAHGETPTSEEFGMTVQKAIKYLCDRMTAVPENSTRGLSREYTNGIATYALAEAYGVTKLPYIKPAMEKGLRFIVRGQQASGGFDYNYAKGARWDLSVAGWQVQALKAGFVAGTDNEDVPKALDKAASFIKGVSYRDGKFGYNTPGSGSGGIQGVGTLCLQLIGDAESREAKAGVKWIRENATVEWDTRREYSAHSNPAYNWYYQTQAMFHVGRTTWNVWNRQMKPQLVTNLKPGPRTPDGKATGFWDAPGGKWDRPEYDRWYTTSLNALSLQVYYRYLPTFKMPKQIARAEKTILDEITIELE